MCSDICFQNMHENEIYEMTNSLAIACIALRLRLRKQNLNCLIVTSQLRSA